MTADRESARERSTFGGADARFGFTRVAALS
jgi:hypothetical protein